MVKLAAAGLVLCLLFELAAPGLTEATVVTTDQGVFVLTSSGVSKVASQTAKVASGVRVLQTLGLLSGYASLAFALYEIGTNIWDWYTSTYSTTGALGTVSAPQTGTGIVQGWGVRWNNANASLATRRVSGTCTGYANVDNSVSWSTVTGGYVLVTEPCTGGGMMVDYYVYTATTTYGSVVGDRPLGTVPPGDRTAVRNAANAYQHQLIAQTFVTPGGTTVTWPSTDPRASVQEQMAATIGVLDSGMGMTQGVDETMITDTPTLGQSVPGPVGQAWSPYTGGGLSPTDSQNLSRTASASETAASAESAGTQTLDQDLKDVDNDLKATPSTAAPVVCPECVRADKWADNWNLIKTAALAAPIFGLINNLVINPTGTVLKSQDAVTSQWGTLHFDLTPWGVDTWIAVLRYVVLFSAMVSAYFIIFG